MTLLGSSYKSSLPSFKNFSSLFHKALYSPHSRSSLSHLPLKMPSLFFSLEPTFTKSSSVKILCFIYPPWDLCSPPSPRCLFWPSKGPLISPLTGFSSSPPTGTLLPQKSSFPPSTQCSCGLTFLTQSLSYFFLQIFLAAPPPKSSTFPLPTASSLSSKIPLTRKGLVYLTSFSLPSLPTPSLWYFVSSSA